MISTWHVIWTTFLSPLPQHGGSWDRLSELYRSIAERGYRPVLEAAIAERRTRATEPAGRTVFSRELTASIHRDIEELAAPDADRVAGNLGIIALRVEPHYVELLCRDEQSTLRQKLGRLKSRSATLIGFTTKDVQGGRGTWSSGFWIARHDDPGSVELVRQYILDATMPQP